MKKLLYIAFAALGLAACTREVVPEKENEDIAPKVKVSFKAVFEQEDLTKAEMSMADGTACWDAGDFIAVHTQNGKIALLEAETDGASVTFSGSISSGDAIPSDAIAYYPASIAIEGEVDKVNLPTSYASATAAAKGFILRGVLSGEIITFKHIGALMKVSIKDIPSDVTSLVFSTANSAVTGELDINTDSPNEPKAVVGSGATSITIPSLAADREAPTTVFYIPLPTGTLTGGFSISLKKDETTVSTKTTTSNVSIARAKMVKMKAFTPEGVPSEWYVAGGFNGWSTTATQMTSVLGHDGWLVSRNITTDDEGFKLFKDGAWKGSNGTGLHTQYFGNDDNKSSNITPTPATYDIYFNPGDNKYFIANAGETWIYKTIHLMCDMELSDATYYLHVWPHDGAGLVTTWPGIEGRAETISDIPYHKFEVAICDGDFTSNTYDCIFHTNDDAIRYDFRSGALAADAINSHYYASFTGQEYNKGVDGTTYGDNISNPMTQFTDPAKPEGASYWGAFVGGSLTRAHWNNGPELLVSDYVLGPTTELKLNFNYKWIFFGPSTTTVSTYSDFAVSRSNTDVFTVPSLDDTYLCDIFLNIFDKTARIEPKAKSDANITLYFGVPNPGTYVNYYTFNGKSMAWPGVRIWTKDPEEGEYVTLNDINYYKAVVKGCEFWNSNIKLIVVSDGISDSQTHDFETADWSGYLDEYYFLVVGKDLVQQTYEEAHWTYTSSFTGVDWNSISWLGSDTPGYIANWKMTSDASNLYVLFKIPAGQVAVSNYIYSGYDTDNGATGDNAGGNVNGKYNAMSLLFPFENVNDEIVVKNGTDNQGKIEYPIGTSVGKPEVHGVIRTDYAYIEMKIPRDKMGSPASNSTVTVNHSYRWYVAGNKNITMY